MNTLVIAVLAAFMMRPVHYGDTGSALPPPTLDEARVMMHAQHIASEHGWRTHLYEDGSLGAFDARGEIVFGGCVVVEWGCGG